MEHMIRWGKAKLSNVVFDESFFFGGGRLDRLNFDKLLGCYFVAFELVKTVHFYATHPLLTASSIANSCSDP
jgi:hypothetical protein